MKILDLNDVALSFWSGGNATHSPGYAWFDDHRFHFGQAAQQQSRRSPRAVNTRYWSQLSTQPIAPALGPARHHADLVHQHLQALLSGGDGSEPIMIAVPGNMGREQLSLLLGILQTLPTRVEALVHRSAALAAASVASHCAHVELQLHQSLVTTIEVVDGGLQAGDTQVLPGRGLLALQDRLATAISRLFVQQTRFDPLRSAATEQDLYDRLPELLESLLDAPETEMNLEGYRIRVTQDDLRSIGEDLARELEGLAAPGAHLLLEAPLPLLPGLLSSGLVSATGQAPNRQTRVSGADVARALMEHADHLRQPHDALVLQRTVPPSRTQPQREVSSTAQQRDSMNEASHGTQAVGEHRDNTADNTAQATTQNATPTTTQTMADEQRPAPTHLLIDHVAVPLPATSATPAPFLSAEGASLAPELPQHLTVNGDPAAPGYALRTGDELALDNGWRAVVISVRN